MDNNNMNNAANMANVNYIREFYKNPVHDYESFFTGVDTSSDVSDNIIKEIKKAKKKIDDLNDQLNREYSRRYAQKYVAPSQRNLLCYEGRGNVKYYFSLPDGQAVNFEYFKDKNPHVIKASYKEGELNLLGGFCYELGGFTVKRFSYKIASDNKFVKLHLISERFIGFLEEIVIDSVQGKVNSDYSIGYSTQALLNTIKGDEFINTLYGTNIETNWCMNEFITAKRNNAAFETIIKTVPGKHVSKMLKMAYGENKAPYQLIGITKETWNRLLNEDIFEEFWHIKDYIVKPKVNFGKTESEWLDLIHKSKDLTKELDFYGIRYDNCYSYMQAKRLPWELLYLCASMYESESSLAMNYSFGKFLDYVVREVIDEGYKSVRDFIIELKDYLNMCSNKSIHPTLYTNSLKKTHDITTRNHTINITSTDEVEFKLKYRDFKDIVANDYVITAPTCTHDILQEGDSLSHCCASYIKRIIDGETLIYFLRKKDAKDESLITLQVTGDKIIQARGSCNRNPNPEEVKALEKLAEKAKLTLAY